MHSCGHPKLGGDVGSCAGNLRAGPPWRSIPGHKAESDAPACQQNMSQLDIRTPQPALGGWLALRSITQHSRKVVPPGKWAVGNFPEGPCRAALLGAYVSNIKRSFIEASKDAHGLSVARIAVPGFFFHGWGVTRAAHTRRQCSTRHQLFKGGLRLSACVRASRQGPYGQAHKGSDVPAEQLPACLQLLWMRPIPFVLLSPQVYHAAQAVNVAATRSLVTPLSVFALDSQQ